VRGIYRAARHWVTAADDEDAAVARPPRPARVRRGPWRARGREDFKKPRGMGAWGKARPGTAGCLRRHGLGRGRRGGRRATCATSRRDGALANFVLLSTYLNANNFNFLNRTVPNFEYESWRSHNHLQLSQRLYGVFLNRFCRKGLPTLNATQTP
jgi:hypothetical protein